jgi:ribosome biogenesis GTPase A
MTKAKRQIEEKLKLIDIAIELLDARIPLASRNPMIDAILRDKARLVLLNKADLADPDVTKQWVAHFAERGLEALPFDASSGRGVKPMVEAAKRIVNDKNEARLRKGIRLRAVRALVVGIPNVGKSTLINRLAGRHVAATGDKPGITKGQQWIKAGTEMELLDTPGILWPKFEDPHVGYRLAVVGSIREQILNVEDIACYALRYLVRHYPDRVRERYGTDVPEEADAREAADLMERIGQIRGCLAVGGKIDMEKAASVVLRDLRGGKLGRISLERPGEPEPFAIASVQN